MDDYKFKNQYGSCYTIVRLDTNSLPYALLKNCEHDCFVINNGGSISPNDIELIAAAVANGQNDWIEIFGKSAEELHDAIDRSAVQNGRQIKVGDGFPMTSWDEEPAQEDDLLRYIVSGGLGSSDKKIVLIIGDESDEIRVRNKMLQYALEENI